MFSILKLTLNCNLDLSKNDSLFNDTISKYLLALNCIVFIFIRMLYESKHELKK